MEEEMIRDYVLASWTRSWMDFMSRETREGAIHVLPLSYNCPRQRFIYYQEIKSPHHDLATINRFLRGRLYHTLPVFPNGETELALKWKGIIGHPDDYCPKYKILADKKIVDHPPKKTRYGYEDPLVMPAEARENNWKQLEYYKILCQYGENIPDGTPSEREVVWGFILYKKADDPYYMAMASKREWRDDETIMAEMISRKEEYERSIIENKIPNGKQSYECGYCDFFNLCRDRKYTEKWGDSWWL